MLLAFVIFIFAIDLLTVAMSQLNNGALKNSARFTGIPSSAYLLVLLMNVQ